MAKLYVAYGSNLNKEQMCYRCPTAKFVGTGIIEGYELQFKGALHGACATIAPRKALPSRWGSGRSRSRTNNVWIFMRATMSMDTAFTIRSR